LLVTAIPVLRQSSSAIIEHASVMDDSALGRAGAARYGLELWTWAPVFGQGPSTYSRQISGGRIGRGNIHNSYVTALADYGLVGFAAFMSVLVLALVRLRQAMRRFPEHRPYLIGLTGALVALYVVAYFHPIEDSEFFWAFPAAALATGRFRSKATATRSSAVINKAQRASPSHVACKGIEAPVESQSHRKLADVRTQP
jgi:O-antigen ligase